MSREEAIEVINSLTGKDFPQEREASIKRQYQIAEAFMMAIEALKQPEQKWVSCSERLPDEKDAGILKILGTEKRSEYVLATVEVKDERMTVTACTSDGEWEWDMKYAFPDYKIIAWMPLPEPYREDKK